MFFNNLLFENNWSHLCLTRQLSTHSYSCIITRRTKKDTNLKKKEKCCISENVTGTFCAICSATGYPCLNFEYPSNRFLSKNLVLVYQLQFCIFSPVMYISFKGYISLKQVLTYLMLTQLGHKFSIITDFHFN